MPWSFIDNWYLYELSEPTDWRWWGDSPQARVSKIDISTMTITSLYNTYDYAWNDRRILYHWWYIYLSNWQYAMYKINTSTMNLVSTYSMDSSHPVWGHLLIDDKIVVSWSWVVRTHNIYTWEQYNILSASLNIHKKYI